MIYYLILNAIRDEDMRLRRAQGYDILCNIRRKRFRGGEIQHFHARHRGDGTRACGSRREVFVRGSPVLLQSKDEGTTTVAMESTGIYIRVICTLLRHN